MTEDRRRHPRVAVDVPVALRADGTTVEGRVRDLSVDATLVEAEAAWPVGTSVSLDLRLPKRAQPLRLKGTVIRVLSGEEPAVAVLFTDMPPSAATEIDLFMSRQ